ncbi:MAG: hypothetical protein N2C14_04695, partial [Planctomycetales bacterium]
MTHGALVPESETSELSARTTILVQQCCYKIAWMFGGVAGTVLAIFSALLYQAILATASEAASASVEAQIEQKKEAISLAVKKADSAKDKVATMLGETTAINT